MFLCHINVLSLPSVSSWPHCDEMGFREEIRFLLRGMLTTLMQGEVGPREPKDQQARALSLHT